MGWMQSPNDKGGNRHVQILEKDEGSKSLTVTINGAGTGECAASATANVLAEFSNMPHSIDGVLAVSFQSRGADYTTESCWASDRFVTSDHASSAALSPPWQSQHDQQPALSRSQEGEWLQYNVGDGLSQRGSPEEKGDIYAS